MIIPSPIGPLGIVADHEKILGVYFEGTLDFSAIPTVNNKKLMQQLKQELKEYFSGQRKKFSIPYALRGTDFQIKVWQALAKIPYGQTRSYQEIAEALGSGARAVGNACRMNPVPVIIPCHRVVAKNGLGGFAGKTQGKLCGIKKQLLMREGI